MVMDLFETMASGQSPQPLAARLRPRNIADFQGQGRVMAALKPFLDHPDRMPNLIFWGPPGSGKTTLAKLLTEQSKLHFVILNAVDTGAKEIQGQGQSLVFIDEIHRLNRAQQDVLLPFTEAGDFALIGATTENPSYELNSALLSRSRVLVFERLSSKDLEQILQRGCAELGFSPSQLLTPECQQTLIEHADGDGRKLLTSLEALCAHFPEAIAPMDRFQLSAVLQKPSLRYDKKSDEHYDCTSAFIKSVRGSDPQAAVYYLARMLTGGEDPVFVARRLVILASEDIGNADPRGLAVAVAGLQAVELVGMPEAAITLSQVTTYLSCAPKSNASYTAIKKAQDLVEKTGTLEIPLALRSARTKLAKDLGYGQGYAYAHEGETGWKSMQFLPDKVKDVVFYEPVGRGFEKTMRQYLDWMTGKSSD